MIFCCLPHQKLSYHKIRRFIKGTAKEWFENIPKEMPAIQNKFALHGERDIIQNKGVCIKPLRSRLEAIQKIQPPTTVKGCRSFVGMVNFLSMFCPELQ